MILESKVRTAAVAAAAVLIIVGVVQFVKGPSDYVGRIAPSWFTLVGATVAGAVAVFGSRRHSALSSVAGIVATVFLLPAVALTIFHALRVVGAIPFPVDWIGAAVSAVAVVAVFFLWRLVNPLRSDDGGPLSTPRWVMLLGVGAAMVYPLLKTYWLLGGEWIRPVGLGQEIDGAFLFPVIFGLAGVVATIVALRWWNRPAPGFARPLATAGGLTLAGLGLGGVYATFTRPDDEGVLIGLLVYGGWLVWGLCTLAVAGRMSTTRVATNSGPSSRPTISPRRVN